MSEELIYTLTSEEMRKLRAICAQLHGGSDKYRDIGHRMWLVLGEIEGTGEDASLSMSETSQEWIAYLRELADAQTVKQIAVNIRQAADCFERNVTKS